MWVSALLGGVILGGSATALWLLNGRIAGISGMIGGAFDDPQHVRWPFLAGLLAVGAVLALTGHAPTPAVTPATAVVAGGLVGVGTYLANGCTSGHGIVGMSRLSPRSLVATCVFMVAAGLTVFVRGMV